MAALPPCRPALRLRIADPLDCAFRVSNEAASPSDTLLLDIHSDVVTSLLLGRPKRCFLTSREWKHRVRTTCCDPVTVELVRVNVACLDVRV